MSSGSLLNVKLSSKNYKRTLLIPIESYIYMDLVDMEHGVLLQTLVNHVPSRTEPHWVDLSVDVAELQSLLQVANSETKVLKF